MNGTAPEPVRNAEFARTFSGVLRTPLHAVEGLSCHSGRPDALLRLMLGEVASVITTGQRVCRRRRSSWAIPSSIPTWPTPCAPSSSIPAGPEPRPHGRQPAPRPLSRRSRQSHSLTGSHRSVLAEAADPRLILLEHVPQ